IGAALGLALMAKATNLTLVPLVPFALVLLAVRGTIRWRRAITGIGLAAIVATCVSAPYFWFNWTRYRHLVPAQEVLINERHAGHAPDLRTAASQIRWAWEIERIWASQSLW